MMFRRQNVRQTGVDLCRLLFSLNEQTLDELPRGTDGDLFNVIARRGQSLAGVGWSRVDS